jgi:5-methylcytosine-specific restriction endonuclease McrA
MTLPEPDARELKRLRLSYQAREVYGVLYRRRDGPPTMREIRDELTEIGTQEQLDRRRRELNRYFEIERVRDGVETRYRLLRIKPRAPEIDRGVSERDRAAALRHGICVMCGRTPLGDGVRLQVDHKIPKEWGGDDSLENLQPLCAECNRGKKNLFASYMPYANQIRKAIGHQSVHRRIGELLIAFEGKGVRSDVIEMVASRPGDYQEDWQKRLRELRVLGWRITTRRRREDGRVRVDYVLDKSQPWPEGSIRAEIRRREQLRGY